ncbi:MAG TPA: hypothetical protein VFP26_14755 [Gemmatimonadaceae bacterium]|jgi:hypothetical protein|nr:hypothetical protein [Gemmatimonadaceae bacterium]
MPRIVESVDIVSGFREQMRVTPLPAWNIEDARANREREHVQQSGYFAPVTFGSKERLVLEEIVGVEGGFPPLVMLRQKNTGSR